MAGSEVLTGPKENNLPGGDAHRRLRRLLNDARWSPVTFARFLILAVLLWVLRGAVAPTATIAAALIIAVAIAAQALFASYWNDDRQARLDADQARRLISGYTVIVSMEGLAWALGAFLLFPIQYPELQLFLVFVLCGVALAFVATLHIHLPACYGAIGLALPMMIVRYALVEQWLEAVLLLIYTLLLVRLAQTLFAATQRTIALQQERDELLNVLRERAQELDQARRQSDDANLAKSRFLAQASHDLRQPLHAIGLLAASLPEPPDERARTAVAHLQESITSLSGLFDGLLDLAVLESGTTRTNIDTLALQPIFEELEQEFAPIATEKAVTLRFVKTSAVVRSDALLLRRMLQNLISNAIRHGRGARVVVGRRVLDGASAIDVVDNGPGIPDKYQQAIFEEFVRVRAEGVANTPGLGLGLAIVGRLAAALGLHVSLQSTSGAGARFRIAGLPNATASNVAAADRDAMDARDHLKGATVLVIDDDRAVLEATAALLRRWGCEVISRTEFPNPLPSVDIVLSDYDLPNDNGLSRLCELRQTQPQLLTALITGDPSQSLRREAEDAGVALLRKPVRPLQLRSLLLKLATTEL